MAICTMFDGRNGFISVGGAELICSDKTCGSHGKAEFGCERCCPLTPAPTTGPSVLASVSKQADLSQIGLSILFSIIGIGLLLLLAAGFKYAFKRWKSRRLLMRFAENVENVEMTRLNMLDQGVPAPSSVQLPVTLPGNLLPIIEPKNLAPVQPIRSDVCNVDMPEEDRKGLLAPCTSVTCIATQEEDENTPLKKTKKDYAPDGHSLVEGDSESEEES